MASANGRTFGAFKNANKRAELHGFDTVVSALQYCDARDAEQRYYGNRGARYAVAECDALGFYRFALSSAELSAARAIVEDIARRANGEDSGEIFRPYTEPGFLGGHSEIGTEVREA